MTSLSEPQRRRSPPRGPSGAEEARSALTIAAAKATSVVREPNAVKGRLAALGAALRPPPLDCARLAGGRAAMAERGRSAG
jgi:hypothetical protein